MPELPEAEIIARSLAQLLRGKVLRGVQVRQTKLRYETQISAESFKNATVLRTYRRAKYINIEFDNGKILLLHMGMSGFLKVTNSPNFEKHDHITLGFGELYMHYNDQRRLGVVDIINLGEAHPLLQNLGVEPLEMRLEELERILAISNRAIKQVLMDQTKIVGIGNIYANEILFAAKIAPSRLASSIGNEEILQLHNSIIEILKKGIDLGGCSIKNFVNPYGKKGRFAESFQVYTRAGQLCFSCGGKIIRTQIQGRSTFHCPICQV